MAIILDTNVIEDHLRRLAPAAMAHYDLPLRFLPEIITLTRGNLEALRGSIAHKTPPSAADLRVFMLGVAAATRIIMQIMEILAEQGTESS